jgi:kynurenine formamidase
VTAAEIRAYEKKHGELRPGDVVILHSGWSDKHYKPLPAGSACMEGGGFRFSQEAFPAPISAQKVT